MDSLFGSLKDFFKRDSAQIDNFVFKLHYKATVVILFACGTLITAKQYIGDPIDCISKDGIPPNLLDTFCWTQTTFSLDDAWLKEVGEDIPYPGVDQYSKKEKKIYHTYYQWVCFVLFFQAVLFYIPRFFWLVFDNEKIKNLILGLDSLIISEEEKKNKCELLVKYFCRNLGKHKCYFGAYFLAEIMNFANVVGQIFFMNYFLNGRFLTYGPDVATFGNWGLLVHYNPMIRLFPRVTKCTFYKYGASGDTQRHDAMCILPINIVNEKIYVFLWFWFVCLATISGCIIIYRLLIIIVSPFRRRVLTSVAKLTKNSDLLTVANNVHCGLGDWLILSFLASNLDFLNYKTFIAKLAQKLNPTGSLIVIKK